MNPNRGETQPNIEVQPAVNPEMGDAKAEKAVEAPARSESAPAKQPSAPPITPVTTDLALDAASVKLPTLTDDTSTTPPSNTKNSDHIERQWIDRAKAIIAQTQDDPFRQKDEMSKVKAEYVKHRFNKVIRTDIEAV